MKKILAVILATATAVSMFATSVSAAFNFYDSIETEAYLDAYDAVEVVVEDDRIIVTQPRYQSAADVIYITDVEGVMDFIEHLNFEGTDRTPEIFEVQKYENDAIEYGTVYMYDYSYVVEPKQEKEPFSYEREKARLGKTHIVQSPVMAWTTFLSCVQM